MSSHRTVRLTIAAMCAAIPAIVRGQPAPDANATLQARADSITVGDYCDVAKRVLATPGVADTLASDSSSARVSAATICDPFLASFSLRALFAGGGAPNASREPVRTPLAAVARVNTGGSSATRNAVLDAMSEFRATVRGVDVRQAITRLIGTDLNGQLVRVSETAQGLLTAAARDRSLDRIARYERKLGPTSPKLNGPEVFLNYAAQRWVRGFQATELGGPSHLELIASYTPGYVPLTSESLQVVSASEFGLRYYMFGERFGAAGWRGVLLPTYWSVGTIVVSDRNGALVWPWQGAEQYGGFVGWGSIKLAYVGGREGTKWLASKQFQAIPFVF